MLKRKLLIALDIQIQTITIESFGLDGGAMFGAVPKVLWEKKTAADERNRIRLVNRSFLVTLNERRILVDLGCGDKFSEKELGIYNLKNLYKGARFQDFLPPIDEVLFTHLHFDHLGGASFFDDSGEYKTSFPDVPHFLSAEHYRHVAVADAREAPSYRVDNMRALESVELKLLPPVVEFAPGFSAKSVYGHTVGMYLLEIESGGNTFVFPSDLIPTVHHLPIPWVTGFDVQPGVTMEEKRLFLEEAVAKNWVIVFQHDPDTVAIRVTQDKAGKFRVREEVELREFGVS